MTTSATANPHRDCWFGEPCTLGRPHECPPSIAAAKRDEGQLWSPLVLRQEGGGPRHYLDGEPVHCGDLLWLQSVTVRSDDYGDYIVALQEATFARYEATINCDTIIGSLYTEVGGHTFCCALEDWHRFRRR